MIYVFGDSIAAGQHVPVHKSWPVLLSRYEPVQVKARCGDTTRLALERMPFDIQAHRPERLIVQFGFNDCNRWDTDGGQPRVSLPAFGANLREIIARARQGGAGVALLTNHPTRRGTRFELERRDYNRVIRTVAGEHGAVCVDLEPGWNAGYLKDEIHPNAEGHEFYCEEIVGALKLAPEWHPI